MNDVCPRCGGVGGAIGSGLDVDEPCHAGPYMPVEEIYIPNPQPQLTRSKIDPAKWGCPRCGWPLDPQDDIGDGGVTCPCGGWVPLPDPPNQTP